MTSRLHHVVILPALCLSVALLARGEPGAGEPAEAPSPADRWYVSEFWADSDGSDRSWRVEGEIGVDSLPFPVMVYEVTRFPDAAKPTPEQQRRADQLVEDTFEAAKRKGWFDFQKAAEDGFEKMYRDRIHYANKEFILDDRVLEPERPEFLIYYETSGGRKLAGVMYLVSAPGERGPQVGGPLTIWHYHMWAKAKCLLEKLLVVGEPDGTGACAVGEPSHKSPEMMHVWLVDHPHGPFATRMSLPPSLVEQLAKREF